MRCALFSGFYTLFSLLFLSLNVSAEQVADPLTSTESPSYDGSYTIYLPAALWSGMDTSAGAGTSASLSETYYPVSGSPVSTTYTLTNGYSPGASRSFTGKPVGTYEYKGYVSGPVPGGGYGYSRNTSFLAVEVLPASQQPTPTPTPTPTPLPTPVPSFPDLGGSAEINSTTGSYDVVVPQNFWPSSLYLAEGSLRETHIAGDGTEVTITVASGLREFGTDNSVTLSGRENGFYTYEIEICGHTSVDDQGYPNVPPNCVTYSIGTAEVFLITEEELDPPNGELDLSRYDIYYGDFNDDLIDGDIYFHGRERFVLIAGDVSIPIVLPPPDSFVMYNLHSGGYTTALRLSEIELQNYTKLQLNRDYYTGDFNGDNKNDYLIRGFESGAPSAVVLQTDTGWPTTITNSVASFDISDRGNTLQVEDYNNDGLDDVLVVSSNGNVMDVAYAAPSGQFDEDTYKAIDESQLFDIATFPVNSVGKTAGELHVNEMGAAVYSIPLYTPQGSGGVAPSIGLSYSSQGGNGVMGQGWSLNAYSGISRCRKVLTIDGETAPLTWTNTDPFCLDGQRLLLISGTNGDDGAVYKTELDTFTRIEAHGNHGDEPDYFTMEAKDGSITYFGADFDGLSQNAKQIFSNGKTLTWNQSRTEDNAQNGINYFYAQDTGKNFRLVRIEYAYGSGGFVDGINPNTTIKFAYERREDLLEGYVSGQQTQLQYRLSGVDVINKVTSSKTLRNYYIFYNRELLGEAVKRRSLVAAIQECVGTKCKQPTRFTWDITSPGKFEASSDVFNEYTEKIKQFKVGDINGDGIQDLVWLRLLDYANVDHKLQYAISENGRLVLKNFVGEFNNIRFPENENSDIRIEVFDYNLDGRSDVAVYRQRDVPGGNRWTVYLSVPNSSNGDWALSSDHIVTNATGAHALVADINGDGLTDIVDENKVFYLGKRSGASPSSNQYYGYPESPTILDWQGVGEIQTGRVEDGNSASEGVLKYYAVADFNGDGLVDAIGGYQKLNYLKGPTHTTSNRWILSSKTPETLFALVQTSNGFEKWITLGSRGEGASLEYDELDPYIVDLNQDGLSDLVTKERPGAQTYAYGRLSNGTGFLNKTELGRISRDAPLYFFDYNLDGYTDLVETYSSLSHVFIWNKETGSYSVGKIATDIPGGEFRRIFEDFNGDGYTDQFYLDDEDFKLRLYRTDGAVTDNLVGYDSGYGEAATITYERLNGSDSYRALNVDAIGSGEETNCLPFYCFKYLTYSADDFYTAINTGIDPHLVSAIPSILPKLELSGPIQLVTRVISSVPTTSLDNDSTSPDGHTGVRNVISTTRSTRYQYSEAKIQAGGRGFLGFHGRAVIDDQTGIATYSTYRQDFPFIGSPLSTVVVAPNGGILSESHNIYDVHGLPSNASTLAANGTGALGSLTTYLKTSYKASYATKSSSESSVVSVVSGDGIVNLCLNNASECPEWSSAAQTQKVLSEEVIQNEVDRFGNVTDITVQTFGDNLTQSVVTANLFPEDKSISISRSDGSESTFSYAELGRLASSVVNRTRNGTTESKNVSFTYFGGNDPEGYAGMLKSETVNPDQEREYTLTTNYTYDSFGNQKTKTTEGWDGSENVERATTTTYDTTGRYSEGSVNAMNHTLSRVTARNEYGAPTTVEGLNGLVTYIDYDAWGRENYRGSNTGAWVTSEVLTIPSSKVGCPTDAKTAIITYDNASSNHVRSFTCYDLLAREVRSATLAFDSLNDSSIKYIYIDTEYDKSSRAVRISEPYFSDEYSAYWTRNYFDELGRVTLTVAPNGSESSASYDGYTSTLVNAKNHSKQETRNAFNELVKIEDAIEGTIQYRYTTEGQLRSVDMSNSASFVYGTISDLCEQPTSNFQIVICYDALGRKSQMWDPDKGLWNYEYNAFGEITAQIDGNGNRTETSYDLLGRTATRTDYRYDASSSPSLKLEGYTRWYYDTTDDTGIQTVNNATLQATAVTYSDSNSVDSLADGANYVERYTYDILGRPETTTVYLPDGNDYQTRIEYDPSNGKVARTLNALSDSLVREGSTFESGVVNHYTQLGFLGSITNIEDGSEIYRAEAFDARSQLTSATLGGLVSMGYEFYEATGLIKEKTASAGSTIQSISYAWDSVGNLEARMTESVNYIDGSYNLSQQEDFCYDNLNRLIKTYKNNTNTSCTLNSASYDQRYDAAGNITYKASVGDYHYGEAGPNGHRAGPHALTSLGNSSIRGKFSYDHNGNLLQDGERSFVYSTFNKPVRISDGTNSVEFAYGPGRNRYYRKDSGEETWYLGNVEKIVKSNGSIEWRRYLEGGTIHTYTTNMNNQEVNPVVKRFMLADHLGSSNILLDAAGSVEQVFGFDEWGLRRDFESMAVLSESQRVNFNTSVTKKGFTGHEMIDNLNLVHMNGRIYDPRWGRFVQADPLVPSATDTQMLNRYSYVRNNPLNAVDPEGYEPISIAGAIVIGLVIGAVGHAIAEAGQPEIGGAFMVIGCMFTGPASIACGAAAAASSTYSATGDFGKSVKAGAISAASSWAFGQLGSKVASGASSAASATTRNIVYSAVVGGTVSELTGGKFVNGAATAAFFAAVSEGVGAASFDSEGGGTSVDGKKATIECCTEEQKALIETRLAEINKSAGKKIANNADGVAKWLDSHTLDLRDYKIEFGAAIKSYGDGAGFKELLTDYQFAEVDPGATYSRDGYVGRWHSHPRATSPSDTDITNAIRFRVPTYVSRGGGLITKFDYDNYYSALQNFKTVQKARGLSIFQVESLPEYKNFKNTARSYLHDL